jgi:hypothetical protein
VRVPPLIVVSAPSVSLALPVSPAPCSRCDCASMCAWLWCSLPSVDNYGEQLVEEPRTPYSSMHVDGSDRDRAATARPKHDGMQGGSGGSLVDSNPTSPYSMSTCSCGCFSCVFGCSCNCR